MPCHSDWNPPDWCDAAIWLMAVADEALTAIGFFREKTGRDPIQALLFVDYWMKQYLIWDCATYLEKKAEQGEDVDWPSLISTLTDLFEVDGAAEYVQAIDNLADLREMLKQCGSCPTSRAACARWCRGPRPACSRRCAPATSAARSGRCRITWPCSRRSARSRRGGASPTGIRRPRPIRRGADPSRPQSLNLLLVPFPYTISGASFRPGPLCVGGQGGDCNEQGANRSRFFRLEQDWLPRGDGGGKAAADQMAEFLQGLIDLARREARQIHGRLPELALTTELAYGVAEILSRIKDLRSSYQESWRIPAPTRAPRTASSPASWSADRPGGQAETGRSWEQAKHHRWKVERHQVRRYHLGSQLDPHVDWWEHIDIYLEAVLLRRPPRRRRRTAPVCEDLRIDLVQTVVPSIGPNLVVALLMDGPQVEHRWSGRYATVLADDPGCSVLTLTSVGLLKRSESPARLVLPDRPLEGGRRRHHPDPHPAGSSRLALDPLLPRENGYTLDGRDDQYGTVNLACTGLYPIKMEPLPDWLTGWRTSSQGEAVPVNLAAAACRQLW